RPASTSWPRSTRARRRSSSAWGGAIGSSGWATAKPRSSRPSSTSSSGSSVRRSRRAVWWSSARATAKCATRRCGPRPASWPTRSGPTASPARPPRATLTSGGSSTSRSPRSPGFRASASARAATAGLPCRSPPPPRTRTTPSPSRPTPGATGHRAELHPLGLAEEPTAALERYLDVVAPWSGRQNFTAAKTAAERVRLLVAPVLPLAPLAIGPRLLDVGSGNGSPGLVLAILRPDLHVTLLEPRTKRWAFLREAVRAAGLPSVEVLRTRHDGYEGPPATTVTVRAVRLPMEELAPLVEPGGRLLLLGSRQPPVGSWVREGSAPAAPGVQVFRRST